MSYNKICKDDEENSEPPLIIDESDDFDLSDRHRHNTSSSDLLCQGCRRNKALFMCAGCSRQWYCSKECQVSVIIPIYFCIPLQHNFYAGIGMGRSRRIMYGLILAALDVNFDFIFIPFKK